METKLGQLPLKTAQHKNQEDEVADSWDAESVSSSSSDNDSDIPSSRSKTLKPLGSPKTSSLPAAPPPTPISPRGKMPDWGYDGSNNRFQSRDDSREQRRPEKSTAVAGRLIAGALGVKVPKKTEEERKYERSIKEQEIKRRAREKEVKEKERMEDEKARTSVWDG